MSKSREQPSSTLVLPGEVETTLPETDSAGSTGQVLWQASTPRLNVSPDNEPVTRVFAGHHPVTATEDTWQQVFAVRKSTGEKSKDASASHPVNVEENMAVTSKQPVVAEKTGPTPEEMFQKGIEQGRRDAEAALTDAIRQQAFEQGLNEGREQAYQKGFDQGLCAAREEVNLQLSTLETAANKVAQRQKLLDRQHIKDIALLLEHLVTEVVRVELNKTPEQICTLVEEALKLLDQGEHETLRLVINPDDSEWLQPLVDSRSSSGQGSLVLRPDTSITRGGCMIEGFSGEVDATIEERLTDCIEQLRASLLDDPSTAPEVDISAISRAGEPPQENIRHSPIQPSDNTTRKDTPDSAHSSATDSTEVSLGAWGALGQ